MSENSGMMIRTGPRLRSGTASSTKMWPRLRSATSREQRGAADMDRAPPTWAERSRHGPSVAEAKLSLTAPLPERSRGRFAIRKSQKQKEKQKENEWRESGKYHALQPPIILQYYNPFDHWKFTTEG